MSVVLPHAAIEKLSSFHNPEDFKRYALEKTKDALKGVDVLYNQVLMAIYIRPEKTAGGIIRPGGNVQEDVFQGKAGLVLKLGPTAFQDDDTYSFRGQKVDVGEWGVFKVGDAWSVQIAGFACRIVTDASIRLKVSDPTVVF